MEVTVDKFRRIVAPKPLRNRLGIESGQQLNIEQVGQEIRLRVLPEAPELRDEGGILVYTMAGLPAIWMRPSSRGSIPKKPGRVRMAYFFRALPGMTRYRAYRGMMVRGAYPTMGLTLRHGSARSQVGRARLCPTVVARISLRSIRATSS